MLSVSRVVVPEGNSVEVSVTWKDTEGEDDAPTSVRYQVFDTKTNAAVSDIVDVSPVSAEMTFVVPGADMPASSAARRDLVIQIEGTFSTDIHTELLPIVLRRRYTFS